MKYEYELNSHGLFDKLTLASLNKKLAMFCGTRRFI